MARFFPEEWGRLREAIPPNLRHLDVLSAFHQLLNGPDQEVRIKAARDWHDWGAAPILLADSDGLPHRWRDRDYVLARARIVTPFSSTAHGLTTLSCFARRDGFREYPASWYRAAWTLKRR
ncbi:hypothetical protein [Rhizobium gallicum]|uniref:hypothetical protein n=1 Tax=Rhizobium gallicum TaxID=56730 RepID=UPI000B2C8879